MKPISNKTHVAVMLILAIALCIYGFGILIINFSENPNLYCTDMYTDMVYAKEVWEHKSLFPEGWVFGNQLYVVATPVWAALFYGITGNLQFSMALASTFMSIIICLSFVWMLKPMFRSVEERMLCLLLFMSLSLFFGDAVGTANGWQLFFTFCSYYACYIITAFLAFGCYLRSNLRKKASFTILFGITCFLSFCTGIQSLRQTAVMTIPLLIVEFLQMGRRLLKREKLISNSFITAVSISLANLLGLVTKGFLKVEQYEIFSQLRFNDLRYFWQALNSSIDNIAALLPCGNALTITVFAFTIGVCAIAIWLFLKNKESRNKMVAAVTFALMAGSVFVILGIDTVTTMTVRSIYYFMIYPLIAILVTYAYSNMAEKSRMLLLATLVVLYGLPGTKSVVGSCLEAWYGYDTSCYEISDYLLENGYTTLYADWDTGEKIAIASEFKIEAGFWDGTDLPFRPVQYLCDPGIYQVDNEHSAYLFVGEPQVIYAKEAARSKNIEMDILQYFPNEDREKDQYICIASENLMQIFLEE